MTLEQWSRHRFAVAGLWWGWVALCGLTGGTIAYRIAVRHDRLRSPHDPHV